MIELYNGDCLEIMDELIDNGIKVNAIISDIPYGTTKCKWDSIIPFEKMWSRLYKIKKDKHTPIVLFGSEPFSSALRMSNIKDYKYDWYWKKSKASNFANAKKMPMKDIENIHLFYEKLPTYNPQGLIKCEIIKNNGDKTIKHSSISALNGGAFKTENYVQEYTNYPKQLIEFSSESNTLHPTQKPVELMEYLVNTYTNKGDIVLDFTMGSGSTGIACINTNRKFIGIELDKKYFDTAKQRIEDLQTA